MSKTTFYRYFKDKNDIMEYHFGQLYYHALFSSGCSGNADIYYMILHTAKENPSVKKLFSTIGYNSYTNIVHRHFCKMTNRLMEAAWKRTLTITEQLEIDFFCAGMTHIFKECIFDDKYSKMDLHDITNILYEMTDPKYRIQVDEDLLQNLKKYMEQ